MAEDVSSKDVDLKDDVVCAVCLDGLSEPENSIVLCDGCDLAVHQHCYGIVTVPAGSWYCECCLSFLPATRRDECVLCPVKGRLAIKQIQDDSLKTASSQSEWAHMVCALWNEEVQFGDNLLLAPIITRNISPESLSVTCVICGISGNGSCVHCGPECGAWFHVTCAQTEAARSLGYIGNKCPDCAWKLYSRAQQLALKAELEKSELFLSEPTLTNITEKLKSVEYTAHPIVVKLFSTRDNDEILLVLQEITKMKSMDHVVRRDLAEKIKETWKLKSQQIVGLTNGHSASDQIHKVCAEYLNVLKTIDKQVYDSMNTNGNVEHENTENSNCKIDSITTVVEREFVGVQDVYIDFPHLVRDVLNLSFLQSKSQEKVLQLISLKVKQLSKLRSTSKNQIPKVERRRSRSAKKVSVSSASISREFIIRPPLPGNDYDIISRIGAGFVHNSRVEPCFHNATQILPYPRREYELIDEYIPAPGLTTAQCHEMLNILQTTKLPECDEGPGCELPVPYSVSEDKFLTSSKCKSRRVACSRSKLARRLPLKLEVDIEATDMWGIDCFVRQNIATVLKSLGFTNELTHTLFITRILMPIVNIQPDEKAHDVMYSLQTLISVCESLLNVQNHTANSLLGETTLIVQNAVSSTFTLENVLHISRYLLLIREHFGKENLRIHPKGVGVRCISKSGLPEGSFVVEYLGELYPPWRWFEKQDAIKNAQRKVRFKPILPDFYNIMLERHADDPDGYNILFVDPIVKGNYASRLCHSCEPNCATVVMAVNGRFLIAVYTLRPISFGEELTFDYSSVTEDENEFKASICLCGSLKCRGAFLYYAGLGAFADVINKEHTLLERTSLILQAWKNPTLTESEKSKLDIYGFKSSVLEGFPPWLYKWTALILGFIEHECAELANALSQKKHKTTGQSLYDTASAESEARGVLDNRRQSLVITLNKIRYFFNSDENKKTPMNVIEAPLRELDSKEVADILWNKEDSRVAEGMQAMFDYAQKVGCSAEEEQIFQRIRAILDQRKVKQLENAEEAKSKIKLIQSLLRELKPRADFRYDAAGDVLSWYLNTKNFFTSNSYVGFRSEKIEIRNVDIGRDGSVVQNVKKELIPIEKTTTFKVRISRQLGDDGKVKYQTIAPTADKSLSIQSKRKFEEVSNDLSSQPLKQENRENHQFQSWYTFDKDRGHIMLQDVQESELNKIIITIDENGLKFVKLMSKDVPEDKIDVCFYGFMKHFPGLNRFDVYNLTDIASTSNVYSKSIVVKEGSDTPGLEWKLGFSFYAFSAFVEGTTEISIPALSPNESQLHQSVYLISLETMKTVSFKKTPVRNRYSPLSVVFDENKKYQAGFVWGQLSGWYKQTVSDPSASLSAERRGTISLPDLSSCFGKGKNAYKDREKIIQMVTEAPHTMWPTGTIWSFRNKYKLYGSPWLDKVIDCDDGNLQKCVNEMKTSIQKKL